MSDFDLALKLPSPPEGASGLVPVGYAEKAMASLMQLHSEVLDEKERRVDLHRRLMEKEQALAELKWYVKLLEEKLGQAPHLDAAPAFRAPAQNAPVPPRAPAAPSGAAPVGAGPPGARSAPPSWAATPGSAPLPAAARTAPLPPPPPPARREGSPPAAAPRAVPRPPAVARQAPGGHGLPPPPAPRPTQDGWKTW
ncbi:MAG: hypothetical protein ACYC8T_20500 [Myxococcaceae bacterium]